MSVVAVMFAACGDSGSMSTGTDAGTGATQAETTTTTGSSTDTDTTSQPVTGTESGGMTTTTSDETTVASESSSDPTDGVETTTTTTETTDTTETGTTDTTTGGPQPSSPTYLWYSVDGSLIYIELNPADGTAVEVVPNELVPDEPLPNDFNALTVLTDGTLLGGRLDGESKTLLYYVAEPPTTPDTPAQAQVLGEVLGEDDQPLLIEALYTDCLGRVYLMDTGVDATTKAGNRLLRFTGDYLAGDFAFEVLTDLDNAEIGDIDDMAPGIAMDSVDDKVGFAIDSGALWQLDYTTGTGMKLADTAGRFGIHALGGMLFDDNVARLYVLSLGDKMLGPDLIMVSLDDYSSSDPLITGPVLEPMVEFNGFSGLAGPLTDCRSALPD